MPRNMGKTDRTLRIIVAIALIAAGLTGMVGGTLAVIGYVVAAVFVLTSLVGTCPAYLPFGIRTCRNR